MFGKLALTWRNLSNILRCRVYWRRLALIAGCWVVMVALPSQRNVRGWLCLPLYMHQEDARGDVAYVMAGGFAYFERLRAASDLIHMHRVSEIYLLDEQQSVGFDFVQHRLQPKVEQAKAYLGLLGVPSECIHVVPEFPNALMGSLSEAQMFAAHLPDAVSDVVVVTSAPHTRRSLMCFQRSLRLSVTVQVYAASEPSQSSEVYMPLWHEYLKLLVYFIFA